MLFSQRIGKTPASKLIQRESMDDDLRNGLWSMLDLYVWRKFYTSNHGQFGQEYLQGSNMNTFVHIFWMKKLKQPVDTIEGFWEDCLTALRGYFFSCKWSDVYDFIEIVSVSIDKDISKIFQNKTNVILENENSAYRFVSGKIAEITSEEEIEEIETAQNNKSVSGSVKIHINAALEHLTDRVNPDYRNSIKESISAVESQAANIMSTTKGSLGELLTKMETDRGLHPSLKKSFSALYGYTSNSDGIRHSLMDKESNLTYADARFMLIVCSAFVNYLTETLRKENE